MIEELSRCLKLISRSDTSHEGIGYLVLASLVAWREIRQDQGGEGWFSFLTEAISGEGAQTSNAAHQIGYETAKSPIKEIISSNEDQISSDIMKGMNQSVLGSSFLDADRPRRSPEDGREMASHITSCSEAISLDVLNSIQSGLERKPLLLQINIIILIEEAALCHRGWIGASPELRKTSTDYAITRLLSSMAKMDVADVSGFDVIFRAIGNMSRLNNAISDSLDRVQSYATKAVRDPDLADAGLSSGRPPVTSYTDLRAAARQSRMFRDRERA